VEKKEGGQQQSEAFSIHRDWTKGRSFVFPQRTNEEGKRERLVVAWPATMIHTLRAS
jgi:hypothetical protein